MADNDMTSADAAGVDEFLCFAVYSANHAFNRVYKPLLDEIGLTYPQYLVMVSLWQRDDQTVGELGEKVFLESSTLTPMLKRLEGMGYIARVRDRQDERQVRVSLTSEGKALRQKALCVPQNILEATGLTEGDLKKLKNEIAHLRNTLLKD
ncbi:MarR family winged helix-turn-helix transcriptional regulator [Pararhizobium arenae]|uniref:MarR family winged helix-turn-helix transcriptional regulator n=1 Tax=Pararhizobium arenae TaxID=1856850 RepID=UPI000B248341|nr:MarR family transcriptional regulator [Pararhizobium arenae]